MVTGTLADSWPAQLAGYAVEHHASVTSTQALARVRAAAGAHRLVVVADEQRGGLGRRGRHWASPEGNLYASIVRRRGFDARAAPLFSLVAAVVVAEALAEPTVTLKWPNDILLGGRKVVGLLLDVEGDALIVGLGVNVTMSPVPEGTSLAAVGRDVDPRALLEEILLGLDVGARDLEDGSFAGWRARWLARAAWLDETVRVELGDRALVGRNRGIDEAGALLVATGEGLVTVLAGDVERVRPEDQG